MRTSPRERDRTDEALALAVALVLAVLYCGPLALAGAALIAIAKRFVLK